MPSTLPTHAHQITETGFSLTLDHQLENNKINLAKLVEEIRKTPNFEESKYDYKIWLSEENGKNQLHFEKLGTLDKIWSRFTCCTMTSQISPTAWQQLDTLFPKRDCQEYILESEESDQNHLDKVFNFHYVTEPKFQLPPIRRMQRESSGSEHGRDEISNNKVAAVGLNTEDLDELASKDPDAAANLCYQKMGMPKAALSRLLSHTTVREKVLAQLNIRTPNEQIEMAASLLQMGHNLSLSEQLPQNVKHMLEARRENAERYYTNKTKKHSLSGGLSDKYQLNPYFYKKDRYLEKEVNLNTALIVENQKNKNLVCRHLSQAMHEKSENYKDLLQHIRDQATSKSLSTDHVRTYDELNNAFDISATQPSVIVDDANFGKLLTDLQAVIEPGTPSGYILLTYIADTLSAHAMWLYIEKKPADKNQTSLVKIGLYDPNTTGNMAHIQLLPEDLRRLKLSDFIPRHLLEKYTDSQSVSVTGVPESFATDPNQHYIDPKLLLESVVTALVNGNDVHIRKVTQSLRDAVQSIGTNLHKQLSASLAYAVGRKETKNAVRAFFTLLPSLKFSAQELKDFFGIIATRGGSSLYFSLLTGDAEAVSGIGDILQTSGLKEHDLKEILEPNDSSGMPGLARALEYGFAETIEAFGVVLEKLNLSDESLKTILESNNGSGYPGLAHAVANGHITAIEAYGKVLETFQSRLGNTYLTDFLAMPKLQGYGSQDARAALAKLQAKFKA